MACMDARLNIHDILGLEQGDAHVIRNAGGVVTEDEIRSLAISQRLLGTGRSSSSTTPTAACSPSPTTSSGGSSRGDRHQAEWAASPSPTSTTTCRSSIGRVKGSPFIPHRDSVRGFVYDVTTRYAREVS